MNRMTVTQDAQGRWEARVGVGDLYVVRVRATRLRARVAVLRMYLSGVGVAA